MPSTAPKSPRCGAWTTCRRSPARARWRCSRPRPTARSRRCGSSAPTPRRACPTRPPCAARCSAASSSCVQEAFATTATAAYADLLLPATTWGEKDGTVTNSERRISRVRAAVPRAGRGAARLAHRRRLGAAPGSAACRHGASTAHAVPLRRRRRLWNEHRESTRGRDLDITGLSYADARHAGPQQWPLPRRRRPAARARLYADGRFPTADGRARFAAVACRRWPNRATRAIRSA